MIFRDRSSKVNDPFFEIAPLYEDFFSFFCLCNINDCVRDHRMEMRTEGWTGGDPDLITVCIRYNILMADRSIFFISSPPELISVNHSYHTLSKTVLPVLFLSNDPAFYKSLTLETPCFDLSRKMISSGILLSHFFSNIAFP